MEQAYNKNYCSNMSFKLLPLAIGSLMVTNVTTHASDIELYKAASEGGATVMLVFDNSGSMDERSIGVDYASEGISIDYDDNDNAYCSKNNMIDYISTSQLPQAIYNDDGAANTTISPTAVNYSVNSCTIGGKTYYDRISRLKLALMPLIANPKTAFGNGVDFTRYKIGLANFFYTNSSTGGGKISYPAYEFTLANRTEMLKIVAGLKAETNTPSAHAYAEVGAYMLGTNTANITTVSISKEIGYYVKKRSKYNVYKCTANAPTNNGNIQTCTSYDKVQNKVAFADIDIPKYVGDYDSVDDIKGGQRFYVISTSNIQQKSPYSGFSMAYPDAVNGNNYISPLTPPTSASEQQCSGNGIYFLTDGVPNNVQGTSAIDLMNNALNKVSPIANPAGTKLSVGTNATCNSSLLNGISDGSTTNRSGWKCMGLFAQKLRSTNNPIGREIITGTAGFGKVFESLAGKTTCDSTNPDASNLCRLGRKGEGFGEGGFYYVETPEQLANSIKSFIAGVGNKEIPAISTGTMSVPLDALNTQQSRGYAYTPILDPRPGVTDLWDGNLKKYYIRNSTVTSNDAGTTKVFDDLTGKFSASTYDIWNTITDTTRTDTQRPDKALPQVGGAFQQVLEKIANDGTISTPANRYDRNLWVNVNGTLTNIKVNATDNKPVGFTALKPVLRTDLVKPTTGEDPRTSVIKDILNNILVFTGFPAQTLTDMDDTTVLVGTPTKTSKNIGGVIHSLPQLVTYGIDLDTNGKFNATTRKDSVLYGSMDGALHLIDDSTGKEQFTFIPKEILDLQSGALIKSGKTTDSKLPYGVDAPWNVYTTYNITSNTTGAGASAVTTNSYVAKQVFASGGLRMGGSTYYSLDITNPSTPSLIYSVGSNYANVLQGQASTIYGMKNGIYGNATTNTDEQKAYSRMGQTWGKPSVGFVRSGGKKVMVNFLPGGYDTRYETANFAADSSNLAQGNAVYMVRVGEEKEDSTTKKVTIDTTSNKGKLLWWASYAASKNGTTTAARPTSVTLQKTEHSDLTNSIVTEIRTVDRNYDGYTDFIYFADLGGRVWRADINNNKDTDNFRVDRLVKLLDVSNQKSGSDVAPRFYERPLFTVTDEVVEGSPIAQITVGTGNRSLPVSDKRDTNMPDAIYSFMDREAGKKDLFCYQTDAECKGTATSDPYLSQALVTKDLTVANLAKVTFTASDATIKTNMMKGVTDTTFKHGWYYPFEQWYKVNGTGASAVMSDVLETDSTKYQGMKMLNEPDAQNGLLFVSVYNPNVNLIAEGCSATVQGATQRMLMCLPFGNCGASGYNTTTAANGTTSTDYTKRSAALAGAGIIDNIITQSKPDVGGSLFGVLQLSCTGTDCDKATFNKPSTIDINTINSDGVNRDKVMNPREWWEN
ncbi:hypothetical protein EOL70_26125 [Leucothrix sargassi]|nr:hypothetical protein EOL70_26125 [Leucothrix sargassi]